MGTLKVNGSVNIQDLLTLKSGTDAYTTPSIAFGTDVRIGCGSKNFGIYSSNKIYFRPNNGTLGYSDGIELSTTSLIPTKNNTVTLGDSTHKWSSIYATTFHGNLSGNADTASRLLNKYNISGDSHSLALKAAFDTYKNSTPKDEFLTYYSSAYNNGSMYMGYFISGYDSTPYGGFYVAHYNTPYYVGIQYGNYEQQTILTSSNYASWCAPASHTHSYLPLSGGTLTGAAAINFPAGSVSVSASTPMSLSYGRLACYGTLYINANTDNSGDEYVVITAGKGLSSSNSDGLAIGSSSLTWQGSTVLTTGNFPSSSSLARQTDMWISAASLDVNTYYPVVISLPANGLNRIKLAVQLNSSTRPSWSTHNRGFTSNIDVEIIQAGWGTVSPFRYLLRQDDYSFANVKPAYFAGQLSNASLAVFYVRGGGSYRFICDWADASISLRTSSTDYNGQTVAPTTSTSVFHSGSKSHLYCNVDYASGAGNADTLDGNHASAFALASHSHSYLPLSGGTMSGTIITPGNDSSVIRPPKSNYDQIGASDYLFWKMFATYGYFNYVVTTNYGTSAPTSTSLPVGTIYYKI